MAAVDEISEVIDPPFGISPEVVQREKMALTRHGRLHLVHWLVVALSLGLTMAAWQFATSQAMLRSQARFDVAARQIPELVLERLQTYELALWAGVSTRAAHEGELNVDEWSAFAQRLDIEDRYPGINGIGIIYQVPRDTLDAFLADQRSKRPDFNIHPLAVRDVYHPITYIYPVDINAEAVGLDMAHEVNRYSSLMQARDTGFAQITAPIVLVQDHDRTPGFLFYAPFYKGSDPAGSQNREMLFAGAVYAPFVVSSLVSGILDITRRSTMIRIWDGQQIIYDELQADGPDYDADPVGEKRFTLHLYGRTWHIDVRAGLDFRAENHSYLPSAILLGGLLVDLVLLALFIVLARANRRALRFADMATEALTTESMALRQANTDLAAARANAENISEIKSNFLSTMSHEVRTPLSAISGIFVLLERAELTPSQSSIVQAGKVASEKLLKLLTDVLDVSRLEAKAVVLWERDVAVQPLVEEWIALAAGTIEQLGKDIEVTSQVSPELPERIVIDDIRLAQVMNNLMDNAVRFTERGSITIGAVAEGGPTGAQHFCVFSVTDTGIGIARDNLENVFERFRQVDGSITRAQGGSGLGLTICYDLVELLQGEIEVTSELGVGTTFRVKLPVLGTRA